MTFKWTDKNVQKLKKMLAKGKSAREIADELGGISRNSVIGKAHRLGLSAQVEKKKVKQSKATKATKAKPAKATKEVIHIAQPANMASESNCQWPIGDPGTSDFKFCYEPARPGRPYCDEHCEKAYRKTK